MRMDSIALQNFRCFDSVRVDFHPELTVLVAPNAGGKTSVLDAIAIALSPFVTTIGETGGKDFQTSESRESSVQADSNSASVPTPFKDISLEATGTLDGNSLTWRRRKRKPQDDTTVDEAKALSDYAERLRAKLFEENAREAVLPLVVHYGTGRLSGSQASPALEGIKPIQPRTRGYFDCLNSNSRFDEFSAWYASMSFSEYAELIQSREKSPERRLLYGGIHCAEKAVTGVLSDDYGPCWLNYDTTRREVTLHDSERGRDLPLHQQSDGVKMVVGLVGDLASRAWKLNPQFGEDAASQTPGIVLIDEVDMHLHPTWQQGVVESLRAAFPKVQFILTTHSPQVLSTVNSESIRMLQHDGEQWYAEQPDEQTSGGESSYIMATVMGASEIPDSEITRKMNDYIVLIEEGKWDSDVALKLRSELDNHYGSMHPRISDCDRLIRFQSFKAKRGEAS